MMGRGSESSIRKEPTQTSIKITFGKSVGKKYEVLMASENVLKDKNRETNHIAKKRKPNGDYIENPMVMIKTEALDFLNMFGEIKKEDEDFVDINDLLRDSEAEAENFKPSVVMPAKTKSGIRLTIDKKDMSVVMISELTPPQSPDSVIDDPQDIKPDVADLERKLEPGIKMVIGKDDTKDEFSVLLQSELKDVKAKKHKCENSGCSKTGAHICVFPPFRRMNGLVKSKGVLNLRHSFHKNQSGFTIFNKTFFELLGCIFYFKTHAGSHIEVRTRSKKSRHRFKLTLYQPGVETSSCCTLGGNKYKKSLALPTAMFSGDLIKYKIVIYAVP